MDQPRDPSRDNFFLPDFCALPVVFAVVVLAELFAFVLALAPLRPLQTFWIDLAFISLFMQWVALIATALLCRLRPLLQRLDPRVAGVTAWLLVLVLVAVFARVATMLARDSGLPLVADEPEFVLRSLAIGAIVSALALRYFYVQHQWKQRLRTEGEARIQALQARIRPHFLFNSMNTIASLMESEPATAEAAIEDLSDLFRASLADARHLVPLGDELELCRRYLHIEQLRLGERLRVAWELEGVPEEVRLPPLTLQPLLENAVYHGIEPLAEGGLIRIRGERNGAVVRLCIENPVAPDARPAHAGNRLAQDNIRERLAAHFGRRAALEVGDFEGGYRVAVSLPYAEERP